jgi:hypothetical protein
MWHPDELQFLEVSEYCYRAQFPNLLKGAQPEMPQITQACQRAEIAGLIKASYTQPGQVR